MKMCKGVRLRRVKVKSFVHKWQMRENTIPTKLSSKHEVCFMMKSAFKVMNKCLWYLDSGCSRHMTRDRSLFQVFKSKKDGNVTFGDGSNSQIKGKGIISLPRLPNIANILYVEGLRVNLLSMSQICDQDIMVLLRMSLERNLYVVFALQTIFMVQSLMLILSAVAIICQTKIYGTKGRDMLVTNIFQLYLSMTMF